MSKTATCGTPAVSSNSLRARGSTSAQRPVSRVSRPRVLGASAQRPSPSSTGRRATEARELVAVDGIAYAGNHGLELLPGAEELAGRMEAFRDAVGRDVEDKGLTLAYHFREAADQAAARAELETVAARATAEGLVPRWGRKVLEIRPPVDADKGTAVRALLRECSAGRALYAGDDTTDVDAFAGLATSGLEHFVRVAVASDEAPPELAESADLVLRSPAELAELLARL